MRPKRCTTFARKTNFSTDVTLEGNQPTPGHIAGRRDQIPRIEAPRMNLSGILPSSVTSCRKVKINMQLLLAITKRSSNNSEENSIGQTNNFRIFVRNTNRNIPARFILLRELESRGGFVAYLCHFDE